jgi:hypothetical protein
MIHGLLTVDDASAWIVAERSSNVISTLIRGLSGATSIIVLRRIPVASAARAGATVLETMRPAAMLKRMPNRRLRSVRGMSALPLTSLHPLR